MDEVLTLDEIKARYAPDWVVIADPEIDDRLQVVRGKVVCHGPDPDELLCKVRELKPDRMVIRDLGKNPEPMATNLWDDPLAPWTGEVVDLDEVLTIDEIKARFAPDSVLIAEPQTDDMQRLLGGKVVFRSPDHDECWRKAREMKLKQVAVRYLGEWPEDLELVL
jgi:hypothetical protein